MVLIIYGGPEYAAQMWSDTGITKCAVCYKYLAKCTMIKEEDNGA